MFDYFKSYNEFCNKNMNIQLQTIKDQIYHYPIIEDLLGFHYWLDKKLGPIYNDTKSYDIEHISEAFTHISFSHNILSFYTTLLTLERNLLHQTKNGEPRMLTFPPNAIQELMKFRETSGLVFESQRKPNQPMDFNKHWRKVLHDAGIEKFRFHDLRHTAASYLVMNGATLQETAQVLGHKSTTTTERYAHLSVEHKQALTDRILGGI